MVWPSLGNIIQKQTVTIIEFIEPLIVAVTLINNISTCGDNKLELIKGDSETIEFEIKDNDGIPIDLTLYSVIFSVKRNRSDLNYIIQKKNINAGGSSAEINMTDPVNGKGQIFIQPMDTSILRELGNDFIYDIQISYDNIVKTVIIDDLRLDDDITR